MLTRWPSWMALLTAGSLWVSGCRTPQPQPQGPDLQLHNTTSPPAIDPDKVEAHAHYGTGVVRAFGDEIGPALEEFGQAALKDPENEGLVLEVSQTLLQAGQPEKALLILERATQPPAASGELFARLGAVYLQLNRTDPALSASRTALKKNPHSLIPYQIIYQIYSANRQAKEALGVLDEAGRVSHPNPEFLLGLGELHLQFGQQIPEQKTMAKARAKTVFQQAAKNRLKEPELQLRLADGLSAVEQYPEAADIYVNLLKDFPEAPGRPQNIRAKLADIYLKTNDRSHAAELLQVILRENPTDARAWYFLGTLAYEQTNFVQAVECFGKTILLNPDFEAAYGELVSAQLALNQTSDARTTLATARKKFPRSFVFEYLSGMAASRQKNYAEALQHFTAAEVIAQATAPARLNENFYFQLGAASEHLGDLTQAEKYFQKSLAIAPNSDEVQNYLGFMWAEHGQHLDEARVLIEKALRAEPKNAAYLDSMAWVLFKLNQPAPALEYAQQAVANSEEEDAEIYHHLGDIYQALGQPEKAREAWRKSVRLEPNELLEKKLGVEPK